MIPSLRETCTALRGTIKQAAAAVKDIHVHPEVVLAAPANEQDKRDVPEMRANIQLAYRHLEDAAMRLGKVLQAADGGTSCYDKQ